MPLGVPALQNLFEAAGGSEAGASQGGRREFDQVVTFAGPAAVVQDAKEDALPAGPTLLCCCSSGAADSKVDLEARPGRHVVREAFADDSFAQEYWRQIQEAHVARQKEQWRAVQERTREEERKMQDVRLRVEEDAKRERAAAFLREQGFRGPNARRRRLPICGRFTYPLHVAVRSNNASLVEVLVWAGADGDLEDSDRLTPLALACKLNRLGSHDRLIVILSTASVGGKPL